MASAVDITLQKNVWTDVTAAIGAAVGAAMLVSNVSHGDFPCRIETAPTVPPTGPIRNGSLLAPERQGTASPAASESVWATSEVGGAKINVELT